MRDLLILGGGTAGTITANKLRARLDRDEWRITVVDRDDDHHYQPGLLFLPFNSRPASSLTRSRRRLLAGGVDLVLGDLERVVPEKDTVELTDGRRLRYDQLVVATGTSPRPSETPGLLEGLRRRSVFDFYTPEGAVALRRALDRFDHGRLVVHVAEMPIKCPVAPLEFAFLVDAWMRRRGLRDRVELVYATPLSGPFTRPVASRLLTHMLDERKIAVETDFVVERVDDASSLVSYDGRDIPFDLLVTVPVNMGADFVARSDLGNELNYVPVDHGTLQSRDWENVFALGDAADLPTSRAGSTAHFGVDVFVRNFADHVAGRPLTHRFDGHANCFVESGNGRALLIDFNYDVEPLPGSFPLPVGPFRLLEETRTNHLGKLAFEQIYWNVLLPGRPMPIPSAMTMRGKHENERTQ